MKEGVYSEIETERFLKKYLPVTKQKLVKTLKEAEFAARQIKFPLVLKIISKDALHKSDIKGVRLVKNKLDFEQEYKSLIKIVKNKKLRFEGILVQEYVKGEYVIIGLKKDLTFGHVIAFGTGGIYTELIKDVSFRVCPITYKDAQEMIDELQMRQLLYGFRGSKKVNIPFLKDIMVAVSKIPLRHPEISEMDINPFVINDKGGCIVDAMMKV
jgi:succinyl-CoA synthetase beta subunit